MNQQILDVMRTQHRETQGASWVYATLLKESLHFPTFDCSRKQGVSCGVEILFLNVTRRQTLRKASENGDGDAEHSHLLTNHMRMCLRCCTNIGVLRELLEMKLCLITGLFRR